MVAQARSPAYQVFVLLAVEQMQVVINFIGLLCLMRIGPLNPRLLE